MNANHACRILLSIDVVIMYFSVPLTAVSQVEAIKTIFHAPLEGFKPRITDFAISPNMKMLATCGGNTNVMLWNFETAQSIIEFQGELAGITKIEFSDDNMILAAGDGWGRVWLWDIPTQKLINRFENPDMGNDPEPTSGYHSVLGLDFSGDGRYLVLQIRISMAVWDLETGERIQMLHNVLDDYVYKVEFLPGGNRVAAILRDNIKVVDLREGSAARIFVGYGGEISRDGTEVYAIRENDAQKITINRWNIETGELAGQSPVMELNNLFVTYPVAGGLVAKNGEFTVISGDGPFPALRRPGVESALRTFEGNVAGGLRNFKFSPDMNYLAATGGLGDGHVYVYDISDLTTGVPNATLHENE